MMALRRRHLVGVVASLLITVGTTSTTWAQQTVIAEQFAVTSGHPDATKAGLEVLRAGGNVIDATVATSLALGVAEPYGSGIGGKGMLLYRDASTGKVHAIEAMGMASKSLDVEAFAARPQRERYYNYTSVAVPGLVAALDAAHKKWGSKPWSEVVTPAADLAADGVTVSDGMFSLMRPKRNLLRRDDEAARIYLVDGETPPVGSLMQNPELAKSLRLIAEEGASAFYEGEIARQIVEATQAGGGTLTLEDMRDYEAIWSEPLDVEYEGHRVYSCPPPLTGGTTVLAALRAMDGVAALETSNGRDPLYMDHMGRLLLAIYPRVSRTIADVPTARDDALKLCREEMAQKLRKEAAALDPANPYVETLRTSQRSSSSNRTLAETSTTHLIVADSKGNIACLTQSLSYHFGACVVAPGTGIVLNNSMSNLAAGRNTRAVNYVAAGKRERSTIAPIIVTKDDRPLLALGIPGGQRIPTTTIQLITDVLRFGTPLDETFNRPRFHVRRPIGSSDSPNIVDLEEDNPAEFDQQLEELDWQTVRHPGDGHYFGGGNAVMYQPDGKIKAVADSRRTNSAAGE